MEDFGINLIGGDISLLLAAFEETFNEFVRSYLLGKLNDST